MALPPSPPLTDSDPPKKTSKLSTTCPACLAGPEKLSRALIEAVNRRDYDNPVFSHMSNNMHTEHARLEARSKAEFFDTFRRICTVYPDYHVEVTSSTGEVDEVQGKAKIWLSLEVTGYPKNIRRESISLLYWRISRGEWSQYRNIGFTHHGGEFGEH